MNTAEGAKKRILKALKKGMRITSFMANTIGKTTEGGRRIRELRTEYPILKEAVVGSRGYVYYLDPEYLRESRKAGIFKKVSDWVGGLFE